MLLVASALGGYWTRHGHVVNARYAPNHGADFDFAKPPCSPAGRPDAAADHLLVRYLGSGGVYLEWNGAAILAAPFFSNHSVTQVLLGEIDWDEEAIARGLEGMPMERVAAILVGHGHYDHVVDLPPILLDHAPRARVVANHSSVNMLAAFEALADRLVDLDDHGGGWLDLTDAAGRDVPIRVLPLSSGHIDQVRGYHYAKGKVDQAWDSWEDKELNDMKEGKPFAFLIDFLSDDRQTIAYRIHYQDSVSVPPDGFVPPYVIDGREADIAVLCMPPYWLVEGYPEGILENTRARHAMVIHYEDFFRSQQDRVRFVAMLTDRRADEFLQRVQDEMSRPSHSPAGPEPRACGPSGEAWTMPLPGEWMRFPPNRP
jgi:L-ascorbate metabolism protein UlaG (beta-lactamase superfamily)